MALIKPFTTPHRITASYHKLLKAEFDCNSKTVQLTFAIFASQQARDEGGSVLWHEYQSIPFTAFTVDPRSVLYPLVGEYGESYLKGAQSDDPDVILASDLALTETAKLPGPGPDDE